MFHLSGNNRRNSHLYADGAQRLQLRESWGSRGPVGGGGGGVWWTGDGHQQRQGATLARAESKRTKASREHACMAPAIDGTISAATKHGHAEGHGTGQLVHSVRRTA